MAQESIFSTTVLCSRYCRNEVWAVGVFEGGKQYNRSAPERRFAGDDKDEKPSPERQQETRRSHAGETKAIRTAIGEVRGAAGVLKGQRVHIGLLPLRVAREGSLVEHPRMAQRNPKHLDVRDRFNSTTLSFSILVRLFHLLDA